MIAMLPSVTFFGNNDDPSGRRDINTASFGGRGGPQHAQLRKVAPGVSGYLYELRGETKANGLGNAERQEALSRGASVNDTL